jgi:hypothetical protein
MLSGGGEKTVIAEIAQCDGDVQLGFAGWGIGKASGKVVVIANGCRPPRSATAMKARRKVADCPFAEGVRK